jgi:hypothetical protein
MRSRPAEIGIAASRNGKFGWKINDWGPEEAIGVTMIVYDNIITAERSL